MDFLIFFTSFFVRYLFLWKVDFTSYLEYVIYMESGLSINVRSDSMKNRLEEIRRQRGIKQEELAAALEVSRQTIGSLENGRYNPSIILAFKIARFFGMNVEEIFIYEGEE